jgi:3-deoxy-D-manno-octulosonic-acid transferase
LPETPVSAGLLLRLYLGASWLLGLRAWRHIERRRLRGKEHPGRWREKAADAMAERPDGTVIWLHAVGLGEVLALRGLIEAMAAVRPDLTFLVTSSARASGEVFDRNRPTNTIHQYLPLDTPTFRRRFLDHWGPALSAWAEQDLWPGFVMEAARRDIPLAMINARMGERAYRARRKARSLYADLYRRFALIAAQDEATARHIEALAPGLSVPVMGSLKAACAPLSDAPERSELEAKLAGREVWLAGPTHPEDEAVALSAEKLRQTANPASLLILAPRLPDRGAAMAAACAEKGLSVALRSAGDVPGPQTRVWIADSFGEMGLWYRLARAALIGGSFGPVQGHNPWEAVRLGVPVLHGPNTANFAPDYARLTEAEGCLRVGTAEELAAALARPDLGEMAARARTVQAGAEAGLVDLRDRLLALVPQP